MREIKFRGQKIQSKEWVYGGFYIEDGKPFIRSKTDYPNKVYVSYQVVPETVGENTGLKGKNGVEIFEGDIFREEKEEDHGDIRSYNVVMWIKQRCAFYLIPVEHYQILLDNDVSDEVEFDWLFQDAALYDFSIYINLPMVGNIFQNPELLK